MNSYPVKPHTNKGPPPPPPQRPKQEIQHPQEN